MNHKQAFKAGEILSIAGVVLILCLYLFKSVNTGFYITVGAAFLLILLSFVIKGIFYRCPKCRKSLPYKVKMPDQCPHCGEKLS